MPRRYLAAGAGALVVAIALSVTVGRLRGSSEGVSPAQLERIVAKNRDAAREAAAVQRARSAVSAEAADKAVELREAEARGTAQADATLARFDNGDKATLPPAAAPR